MALGHGRVFTTRLRFVYLRDILERMVDGHPMSRVDDLLPWNWTATSVNP